MAAREEAIPGLATDTTATEKKKVHALIFCAFIQSHFAAAYRLSLLLAQRGVTITFPVPKRYLSSVESSDDLRGLDFNIVALADDPDGLSVSKATPASFAASVSLKKAFEPILRNSLLKKAGVATPSCIIADRFVSWTADAAKQLKVPYYVLLSNGSVGPRMILALPDLVSQGVINVVDNKVQEFEGLLNVSGLPPLRYQDTPAALRHLPTFGFMIAVAELLRGADGVLINTFYDLTSASIDAIRMALREVSPRGVKVFPIGPLSTVQNFKDKTLLPGLDNAENECLQWLDEQPPSSVLYICLGSLVRLASPQIYELALALEASQQKFVCVLPKSDGNFSTLDDVLPPGYRARLQGRGIVVSGWVPQLLVLGHSSVGSFLTHCGWNSVIESTLMGVPMIAWPHQAEQHLNCRFLVTELKTAVEIGGEGAKQQNDNSGLVKAEEFVKAINMLMKEEEGRAIRKRAQDLKVKAAAAVEAGGTSQKTLQEFIDHITKSHTLP